MHSRTVTYLRALLLALVAVLTLAFAAPPVGAAPVRTDAALQALLDAEHAAGMPGVFAQVRKGHDVWQGAAGVADVDTGEPVRPWFRHRVGSITKTFVATTVLQLVGERRVQLDRPARDYLSALGLPDGVTVRMLLNHTSGLGNYTEALFRSEADLEAVRTRVYTPEELLRLGLSLPPTHAPGTAWRYSNTNYIVLGLLIEQRTGHAYSAEVRRRILRPLGLRDTYFPGADPYLRGPHAKAYVPGSDGTLRDFSVYNMSWGWAAGELVSTARDLNRFFRALLTGRLLAPRLLAQMQATVPMDPSAPEAAGYGLGIAWLQLPCGRVWGHDGGVIGQTTVSLHSGDGARQVSLAENMNFYAAPSQIDEARGAFLVAALCGSGAGSARAAGVARIVPLTPRLPLIG